MSPLRSSPAKRPTLKNYRSRTDTTFEVIQQCLAQHRAKRILFDYDDAGRISALAFSLEVAGRDFAFRLPARVENVERLLYGREDLTEAKREQAFRTAWANIRDWLLAQMALIDTGMVKTEEVFLPYMLNQRGQTYFEVLEPKQFLLEGGAASAEA